MSDVMLGTAGPMEPTLDTFRHEAFLYAGTEGFLEGTVPFIEAGLSAGEPVLVVVAAPRIEHLRNALGHGAGRVSFADMGEVGRNPARIIPAWRDFLAEHGAGRPARGIGSGPPDDHLPEPPVAPQLLTFGVGSLEPVRQLVTDHAAGVLGGAELSDFLLAVTEVAANSPLHGGGVGTLRVWTTDSSVVCEVRDRGWIREPLVGRARPRLDQENGRGLWMVNQLCDLGQLRVVARGHGGAHAHAPPHLRPPSFWLQ